MQPNSNKFTFLLILLIFIEIYTKAAPIPNYPIVTHGKINYKPGTDYDINLTWQKITWPTSIHIGSGSFRVMCQPIPNGGTRIYIITSLLGGGSNYYYTMNSRFINLGTPCYISQNTGNVGNGYAVISYLYDANDNEIVITTIDRPTTTEQKTIVYCFDTQILINFGV